MSTIAYSVDELLARYVPPGPGSKPNMLPPLAPLPPSLEKALHIGGVAATFLDLMLHASPLNNGEQAELQRRRVQPPTLD